jgi:hypothetical protein
MRTDNEWDEQRALQRVGLECFYVASFKFAMNVQIQARMFSETTKNAENDAIQDVKQNIN